MIRKGEKIPFDLIPHRAIQFSYTHPDDHEENQKLLRVAVAEATEPGINGRLMSRPTKTKEELRALILSEIAGHPVCPTGMDVSIEPTEGGGWNCAIIRPPGTTGPPGAYTDCVNYIDAIVQQLQSQYDLSPDAAALLSGAGGLTAEASLLPFTTSGMDAAHNIAVQLSAYRQRRFAAIASNAVASPPLLPAASPPVPDQSLAPVRVEERDGKIARVSDSDSPLLSAEADFNAWREPIIDHVQELLTSEFRQGTNHSRARDRLVALGNLLPGSVSDVKERQFRIGYEVERLEGLIAAYRTGGDDMPALNAAVLEDLDRLHRNLQMGIDKLERWAEFRRMALHDPLHEGGANPTVVSAALDEMAAVMERQPKYFDSELPATFRFLAEAVRDPVGATTAVVYGAVRSAENLISFLGRKALGIATKTADAVEKHISTAIAAALISGLAGAALQISGALPAGWAWLKPLLDAVAKAVGS
jgi:hypothetical protein